MSYLSFDEISDRYNQLAQVDLTEEDLAIAEGIYLNIVNTLVEKSHTATGILKFLETQVNDENILEFFTEEPIEISEEWGDNLAKWEKDLLLFNVEGHKLELMESALKGIAKTLLRSLKRSPLSSAKRVRAAHRSRRLGKPQPMGKASSDAALSGGKTGAYRSTGSGTKTSIKSTADDKGVPTTGTALKQTPGAAAASQNRSQRADYRVKKKADQARVAADKAAGKDPFRIKKRDFAAVGAGVALAAAGANSLKNKGSSSSTTPSPSPSPSSKEPPKPTAPKGPSQEDIEKEKRDERFKKVRAYCYQNPRKCRSMADGDYDKESMRKELNFDKPKKSTTKEWMENYPELAQTINEQKEVTEMNNQTHDAYDIILDYLLENGHAETMDEANYVMLEMDEEHLQKIVQLSSES